MAIGTPKTIITAMEGERSITSAKTGKAYKITATAKILEFLQKLLTEVGAETWLEDNDGKFDTFEQLL